MICLQCEGDGGWERAWGFSAYTGELRTDWVRCSHCEGRGVVDIGEDDPPGLDELLDEDAAIAASEG